LGWLAEWQGFDMALFNAPNLLPQIFQKEQYPEGSGIVSMATGLIGGLQGARDARESEDYNFVNAMQKSMQRGAELDTSVQKPLHPLQRALHEQNIRKSQIEIGESLLKRELELKQLQGLGEISRYMVERAGEDDPITAARTFHAIRHRYNLPMDAIEKPLKQMQDAANHMRLMELEGSPAPEGTKRTVSRSMAGTTVTDQPISDTETERFFAQYKDLTRKAEQARLGGDAAAHEALMQEAAEIQGFLGKGGVSVSAGFDNQGRQIFDINVGGRGAMGRPTVATQSTVQQADMTFRSGLEMINELRSIMRPEDVGIWGLAAHTVLDKLAGQVFPELVNLDRVDTRTMIGVVRERLFKALAADARINRYDIERMKTFLPTDEALTSYRTEQQKLDRLQQSVRLIAREYAKTIGEEVPLYALEPQQLMDRYKAEEENLRRLVEGNYITPETAESRLLKLHDEITDTITKFAPRPRQQRE
jgi:hypothetical protein